MQFCPLGNGWRRNALAWNCEIIQIVYSLGYYLRFPILWHLCSRSHHRHRQVKSNMRRNQIENKYICCVWICLQAKCNIFWDVFFILQPTVQTQTTKTITCSHYTTVDTINASKLILIYVAIGARIHTRYNNNNFWLFSCCWSPAGRFGDAKPQPLWRVIDIGEFSVHVVCRPLAC